MLLLERTDSPEHGKIITGHASYGALISRMYKEFQILKTKKVNKRTNELNNFLKVTHKGQ